MSWIENPDKIKASSKEAWMTNEEMSNKWDGIFSEFLSADGYQKEIEDDGDEYWRKKYSPENA